MKQLARAACVLFFALFLFCSCESKEVLSEENLSDANPAEATVKKAESTTNNSDILNLCIYQIDTLNPLKTSVKHNAEVLSLLYDSLFTAQSDFSSAANLAEDFSLSSDGLTFTVQVRSGVKFSNGAPLTGSDVAASVNTIIASNGYYKTRLGMLKGASSKGNCVEIYLKKPTANLNILLDFPILPNGGSDETPNEESILSKVYPGTGIYELAEYNLNRKILLKANRKHFSGAVPYIEAVAVHMVSDKDTAVSMLENSMLDVITGYAADTENYTPQKNLTYKTYNGCRFVFIYINPEESETNTSTVRRAVSAAVNRKEILSSCGINAVTSTLPIHPNAGFIGSNVDVYDIKPSEAAGLLVSDDWADTDGNGILDKTVLGKKYELSFELLTNADNPSKIQIAEIIRKNMAALGVNIKIRALPFDDFNSEITSGSYDLFLGESEFLPNFDLNDILTLLKTNITSAVPLDNTKAPNPTQDFIVQNKSYSQLLSIYHSHIPVYGLFFRNEILLCDKKITMENIATLNPYKSICTWSIAK